MYKTAQLDILLKYNQSIRHLHILLKSFRACLVEMAKSYLRSPDSYPNGRTPLTPSQPPIGPLPIIQQSDGGFILPSPATPPEAVEDFSEQDQLLKLCEQLKGQSCTVAVWYPTGGDKLLCERIAIRLREHLSGRTARVEVIEMKKDGQLWVSIATAKGVNYHVFVGLPPLRSRVFQRQNSSAQEEEFFLPHGNNGHRVSEVVFIDTQATTPSQRSYQPKQVKGFLHLDARGDIEELVKKILGHFGGGYVCVCVCVVSTGNRVLWEPHI